MDVKLRLAVFDDLEYILEIINDAIINTTAFYQYSSRTFEEQKLWLETKQKEGFPVIVAEYNNKVIGYGTYGFFKLYEGYRFTIEHSIYVSDQCRGKGIGKQILKALIQSAKEEGYHVMVAVIDADNKGSVEFHKDFGFEETGGLKEVGFKFKRWLSITFMQLLLIE